MAGGRRGRSRTNGSPDGRSPTRGLENLIHTRLTLNITLNVPTYHAYTHRTPIHEKIIINYHYRLAFKPISEDTHTHTRTNRRGRIDDTDLFAFITSLMDIVRRSLMNKWKNYKTSKKKSNGKKNVFYIVIIHGEFPPPETMENEKKNQPRFVGFLALTPCRRTRMEIERVYLAIRNILILRRLCRCEKERERVRERERGE